MRPLKWTELREICESEGWRFDRTRGDHYVMTKPGMLRPVVIPMQKDLKEGVVLSVGRTIGLSKKQMVERLDNSKQARAKRKGSSRRA